MWRMLHENCNFSLKNAAKVVELSKKTLDDYFLVLRVA
jgi:DNA-binding XRE family transcriptional regulator